MGKPQWTYEKRMRLVRDGLHYVFSGGSVAEWREGYMPDDGIWATGEDVFLGEFCTWVGRGLASRGFVPFDPDSQPKKLVRILDAVVEE